MKVKVTKEEVTITEYCSVNAGSVGVEQCTFELPPEFSGLSVTAVFNGIPVLLTGESCFIPTLIKGSAVLGVYAYSKQNETVTLMYSPKPTLFYVEEGSFCEVSAEAKAPEISQYEEYCKMIRDELLQRAAAGEWKGKGVPAGGQINMVLQKSSNTDYDAAWALPDHTALEEADAALENRVTLLESTAASEKTAATDLDSRIETNRLNIQNNSIQISNNSSKLQEDEGRITRTEDRLLQDELAAIPVIKNINTGGSVSESLTNGVTVHCKNTAATSLLISVPFAGPGGMKEGFSGLVIAEVGNTPYTITLSGGPGCLYFRHMGDCAFNSTPGILTPDANCKVIISLYYDGVTLNIFSVEL